nr:MAG TPA: hypothetical protein [Caudoviricetes sp.]
MTIYQKMVGGKFFLYRNSKSTFKNKKVLSLPRRRPSQNQIEIQNPKPKIKNLSRTGEKGCRDFQNPISILKNRSST